MLARCQSPVASHMSAMQLDEVILAARAGLSAIPLPSAHALLQEVLDYESEHDVMSLSSEDVSSPQTMSASSEEPPMPPLPDSPVSPDLKHSRLARRWFKGMAAAGTDAESTSMLDLTKLSDEIDETNLTLSPTSIMGVFY